MVDKVEDACANNKRRCSSDAPSSHMGILTQSETWNETRNYEHNGFSWVLYPSLGPPFNGNGWEDVFGWVWRIFKIWSKYGEKVPQNLISFTSVGQKKIWSQDETIWSLLMPIWKFAQNPHTIETHGEEGWGGHVRTPPYWHLYYVDIRERQSPKATPWKLVYITI